MSNIATNVAALASIGTEASRTPVAQAQTHAELDADIFLKRSAAYYNAHPPSSLESVSATHTQRDPMLAETLQSLAPPDTHFSPASMHARLKSAEQTLTQALAKLKDAASKTNAQQLQQQISSALTLQQEAFDNQRLLIKA